MFPDLFDRFFFILVPIVTVRDRLRRKKSAAWKYTSWKLTDLGVILFQDIDVGLGYLDANQVEISRDKTIKNQGISLEDPIKE